MRNANEMMGLIRSIAAADERVRAVFMNGSRVNPSIQKDDYCDFDIVYVVTETASFIADKDWLQAFGKPLIIQEPDSNDLGWGLENDMTQRYVWLMLFDDGNRIDLTVEVIAVALDHYQQDSLTLALLDKDGILPTIPPPDDSDYWIKPPTEGQFLACCNEFWWCLNNVAKGIARNQLPYALRMYYETVHQELEKMTEWYIGVKAGFSISSGMWGKYFQRFLPPDLYEQFLQTYSAGNGEHLWAAIATACDLFHSLAQPVALHLGIIYRQTEESGTREYLARVRSQTH